MTKAKRVKIYREDRLVATGKLDVCVSVLRQVKRVCPLLGNQFTLAEDDGTLILWQKEIEKKKRKPKETVVGTVEIPLDEWVTEYLEAETMDPTDVVGVPYRQGNRIPPA